MDPYLNITVGHYNANTDWSTIIEYSKKDTNFIKCSIPAGMWQKAEEIICDDNIGVFILKEYRSVRNIWNPFEVS